MATTSVPRERDVEDPAQLIEEAARGPPGNQTARVLEDAHVPSGHPAEQSERNELLAPAERVAEQHHDVEKGRFPGDEPESRPWGLPSCAEIPEESLGRLAIWFIISGLSMTVLGIVCVAAPSIFRVVMEEVLGAVLVFLAIFAIIHGLWDCGAQGSYMSLIYAFVQLLLGILLIAVVIKGLSGVLQTFLAAWLIASGICKIMLAIQMRHLAASPIVFISGVLSLIFFQYVVTKWHRHDTNKMFGLVIGAELVSSGLASSSIAMAACCSRRGIPTEDEDYQPLH